MFERKCSYTYQLYTWIFTFYCTFNGNLLHLMRRKKKKNCKTKCPKKCFPCKHWNPPCCLPLLYLKKHVVQLSTSVENHAVFSHWIKFYQCLLYHRNRKSCFYLHKLYTMRVANYILSSPRVLLCNPRLWFLTRITVQKPWKWSWQCTKCFTFFVFSLSGATLYI